MQDLPTGTITFLFTDIEGSTSLWENHPEPMRAALARHDDLLRDAIEVAGGYIVKTTGDGAIGAFQTASDALGAALTAQLALAAESWPEPIAIRVRMALHTDTAELRDGDYYGPALNRAARLMAVGHGGQVLLSATTSRLANEGLPAGVTLRDLGRYQLKDLQSEQIFQLCHPALADDFRALRTLNRRKHNLPVQATHFIGRETDTGNVQGLLTRTRLLTVTGAGGMGKTRLSLNVAAGVIEDYPDGVWQVELAPVSDPAHVAKAVASALEVREETGRPLVAILSEALKLKKLLLLLDNCEHVLESAATLAAALMRACPGLRILATSREALGVSGEQIYLIPALTLPRLHISDDAAAFDDLVGSEAVRLFADRASLVNANFAVSAANGTALRRLCHRLDGIPLALELAAARVRSLPVEQIESRLHDRFRLLTGGSRTALPRQQTLRALIDWSYDLLNDRERALLQRLSLFAGGWTIKAAEAVCAGDDLEEWEIFDVLLALVDKSLVIYDQSEGSGRYRMLETVRQYARERLQESGDLEKFLVQHRDYYVTFARAISRTLVTLDALAGFRSLEVEHENLRAAVDFSLVDPEGAQQGLRLGAALARFWWTRDFQREGRQRLEALISRPGAEARTAPRAEVLNSLVAISWLQGDNRLCRERLEESLSISRASDDHIGMAVSLTYLGNLEYETGNYDAGNADLEEGLALFRELGNRYLMTMPLTFLGILARILGDRERAHALLSEALSMAREQGARWWVVHAATALGLLAQDEKDYPTAITRLEEGLAMATDLGDRRNRSFVLSHLGRVQFFAGGHAAAENSLRECLDICLQLGNRPVAVVAIEAFALLARLRDQPERAIRLWSIADRMREEIDRPRIPVARARYEEEMQLVSSAVGGPTFDLARRKGAAMSYAEAIAYTLSES